MSDKPHGPTDNPLTQLWIAMSGASAGHHEAAPGVDDKSVAVGHEPDRFGLGGIIAVPIAVIVAVIVTYVTVTLIFRYVNDSASDAIASKDVPVNDRLGRIGSTGGQAVPSLPGQPSGEPRLDGTPKIDTRVNGKDVAPYLMSFRKTPSGNWPDLYPEDLRPERYVDYDTQRRPLVDPAEAHEANKAYARLPITQVTGLLGNLDHHRIELVKLRVKLPQMQAEQKNLEAIKERSRDEQKRSAELKEAIRREKELTVLIPYLESFARASDAPNPALSPAERPKQSNGGQTTKAPSPAEPKSKPH